MGPDGVRGMKHNTMRTEFQRAGLCCRQPVAGWRPGCLREANVWVRGRGEECA